MSIAQLLSKNGEQMPPIEDEGQSIDDLAGLLTPKDNEEADAGEGAEGDETPADDGADDEGEDGNPDGTDADEDAEAGEGEEPEGDESDEGNPEPFYTVKIDGKEERVTLKEALDGYQRNKDYTRKTQEVAKDREALQAETAAVRQHRSEYAEVLKALKERIGTADKEPTEAEWNALRASDPTAYNTQWTDFQRRAEQRRAIEAEQARLDGETKAENTKVFRTYLDGERVKLQAALPVLADKEKGPKELAALRQFAGEKFGYSEAELNQAYDHRLLLMVDMARKWDAHSKALVAAKQKVKAAPNLPEPGSRQNAQPRKIKARAEQMKKFERSGKVDDAISLIMG